MADALIEAHKEGKGITVCDDAPFTLTQILMGEGGLFKGTQLLGEILREKGYNGIVFGGNSIGIGATGPTA